MENTPNHMRNFNSFYFKDGETIMAFNLRYMKLFNKLSEVIQPTPQAYLVHYYNSIPHIYFRWLEEKGINCLGLSLEAYLEFEEQNLRICLPFDDVVPKYNPIQI